MLIYETTFKMNNTTDHIALPIISDKDGQIYYTWFEATITTIFDNETGRERQILIFIATEKEETVDSEQQCKVITTGTPMDKQYKVFFQFEFLDLNLVIAGFFKQAELINKKFVVIDLDKTNRFSDKNFESIVKSLFAGKYSYVIKLLSTDRTDDFNKKDISKDCNTNFYQQIINMRPADEHLYCYYSDNGYVAIPIVENESIIRYDVLEPTLYICATTTQTVTAYSMETTPKKYTPEEYYIKRKFKSQNFRLKDDVSASYTEVLFMETSDNLSVVFITANSNDVSENVTYISIYQEEGFIEPPIKIEHSIMEVLPSNRLPIITHLALDVSKNKLSCITVPRPKPNQKYV